MTEREEIDIERGAEEFPVFDATLTPLERQNLRREVVILWLSVGVIIVCLCVAVFSATRGDEQAIDRGWQLLFTLVGFAAGAIWKGAVEH